MLTMPNAHCRWPRRNLVHLLIVLFLLILLPQSAFAADAPDKPKVAVFPFPVPPPKSFASR